MLTIVTLSAAKSGLQILLEGVKEKVDVSLEKLRLGNQSDFQFQSVVKKILLQRNLEVMIYYLKI